MRVKEINLFLFELSEQILKPLNQIGFQILILINLHFLFENLRKNKTLETNNTKNSSYKTTKSFIILISIISVFLDWFIWNNLTRTTLFISILAIYIYYNLNNITIISTFITISKNNYYNNNLTQPTPNIYKSTIPTIPANIIKLNINNTPEPYNINNINNINTKSISEAHKTNKTIIPHITDIKYAEIISNDLYN
jgi:hypothetical protein